MKIIRFKNLKFIPSSHEDKNFPNVWKKVLVQKNDLPRGRLQMINWAKLLPGKAFRRHYHEDMLEIFIILVGKAKITVGKKSAILKKGDAVIIPKKQIHEMKNLGKKEVEYIAIGISQEKGGKTIVV